MHKWPLILALIAISCSALVFAASLSKSPHRKDQHVRGLIPLILPHIKGAINKHVTQHTITGTICVSGYTKSIRPSVSYTQSLKATQIATLHYTDTDPKHYEEDHFLPLELGGNPTSSNNLWPEPWTQAALSDPLENKLHREVCALIKTLKTAQTEIKQYKLVLG